MDDMHNVNKVNDSARHQFTLQDHRYGAGASCNVPVYARSIAGTHCIHPQRDGPAKMTWVHCSQK